MNNDKFIDHFITFIENNFDRNEHLFIVFNDHPESKYPIQPRENIVFLNRELGFSKNIFQFSKQLIPYFTKARIVILHGLFIRNLVDFLFINQRFLKKCRWVMWGGDLYHDYRYKYHTIKGKLYIFRKKTVIRKLQGLITYVKGDYELAKKWYGAKGEYYECFMYPSNLYKEYDVKPITHDTINIQVGNSADPSNNHIDVFEQLLKFKNENIKIYVPLSYGNSEHTEKVISAGNAMFGDKFIPMTDFMVFDQYLHFLADIDIAIFNHKRQQAMGNIITLLGLGKKVYLRNDITPWQTFEECGIHIFDVEHIEISQLDEKTKQQNMARVKEYFSKENFVKQLENVFR
jgi:hypothetical protein